MHKLNQWRKEGIWDIYETCNEIIIGEPKNGYVVLLDKGAEDTKPYWDNSGIYFDFVYHSYVGTYGTKNKAVAQLTEIVKTLNSNKVLTIATNDKNIKTSMLTSFNKNQKGAVILYHKGDVEGLAHELGHIEAGHTQRFRGQTYNDELQAIKHQIKILDTSGYWNQQIRKSVVKNLSTYSKKPYQKKRRALRDISRIENKLGIMK
jgi:hypothetical protein